MAAPRMSKIAKKYQKMCEAINDDRLDEQEN